MASIVAISGSPSRTSRTALILDQLARRFAAEHGHVVHTVTVRELPPGAVLGADPGHPAIAAVVSAIADADAVVVATPVYKAAYSGVLKALLDLLPQFAFAGKAVLPLATGGTVTHVLAIDYALRPVLSALGADHILPGYFLLDKLITATPDGPLIEEPARVQLDGVVAAFLDAVERRAGRPVPVG